MSAPSTDPTDYVLRVAEERFGSRVAATAWFDTYPLEGTGGATPKMLVEEGHADWIIEYFAAIDAGIHT